MKMCTMHCLGSLSRLLRRRRHSTGIIGWFEVIESVLSTTLDRSHRNRNECCRDATTGAKDAKVQKTGPSYAHSMTVDVQLYLRLGVAEVSRNRRNREGYSCAVHG